MQPWRRAVPQTRAAPRAKCALQASGRGRGRALSVSERAFRGVLPARAVRAERAVQGRCRHSQTAGRPEAGAPQRSHARPVGRRRCSRVPYGHGSGVASRSTIRFVCCRADASASRWSVCSGATQRATRPSLRRCETPSARKSDTTRSLKWQRTLCNEPSCCPWFRRMIRVGVEHVQQGVQRATPAVVEVLRRFPAAPGGGGRAGELIRMLDADLREGASAALPRRLLLPAFFFRAERRSVSRQRTRRTCVSLSRRSRTPLAPSPRTPHRGRRRWRPCSRGSQRLCR